MNSSIVPGSFDIRDDIEGLMQGWIAAEQNGDKYPVPFDLVWGIAGYQKRSRGAKIDQRKVETGRKP